MMQRNDTGETFGRWLLAQRDREGCVGDLVKAARGDPQFPRDGNPEAVRKRLRDTMVERDMFEAVDDAEFDWLGSSDDIEVEIAIDDLEEPEERSGGA